MDDEALFGRWLQRRRRSMGLTQEGLADLIGCSSATIRKIEAEERRPSVRVARKLAQSLEIPVEERDAFLRFARGGWSDEPPTAAGLPAPLPWNQLRDEKDSLPAPMTELLGRGREVQTVLDLLRRPGVRLVTMTGPGGIGKTRLALETARQLRRDFGHGAHFVMLAPLRNPDHLPSAIAPVLGVQESGSYPLWDKIKDDLRDKDLLLVLDNFEQIIAAAPRVSDLLQTCARLKILVTSREVLRLPGEHELPVPPLHAPDRDGATSHDARSAASFPAVELFLQRAREARPDFELTAENASAIAELCSRLDGLPLAIELAAARVRLLPPHAMLERLAHSLDFLSGGTRDAPERQKTMRQAIAWSYDLLDGEEQKLLRRVSVFSGGFTLDAAEAVGQPEANLLDALASLVEKSLLGSTSEHEPRFSMLETIREYGLERLAEQGEEAQIRRRHAEYFAELTARVEPELHGPDQARWMKALGLEHPNIRAALRWSLDSGETDAALRLAAASWWYWYVQGHVTEGRALFAELLPKGRTSGSSALPSALIGAARLAVRQNDDSQAALLYAEAERLSRTHGDSAALTRSLQGLARVATHGGDLARARRLAGEALAIAREHHYVGDAALCLNELGEVARSEGAYDQAAAHYEESLAILRARGDKVPIVSLLANLGYVALRRGDLGRSALCFQEGLRLAQEVGDVLGIATTLAGLAGVAAMSGDVTDAALLFGAAEAVHGAGGLLPDPVDRAEMDRNIAHARLRLPAGAWTEAFELGKRMTVAEAVEKGLATSRWGGGASGAVV